jgi:glycosyltransferase involved in cell wall biosynthesis
MLKMEISNKKLLIIIPAFNEAENIIKVIEDVKQTKISIDYEILIINDCSTDNTEYLLTTNKINHIGLSANLGIGGAVQTGFCYAVRNDFDFVIQLDGDGQHPAINIQKLINEIEVSGSDIVIGTRFLHGAGFQSTFLRRLGIILINKLILLLCEIKISDSTSGLRIYNRNAIKIAADNYPDEYPEPESIVIFHFKYLSISETQVIMTEREKGVSSISGIRSIYYMFKVLIAIFFTFLRNINNR